MFKLNHSQFIRMGSFFTGYIQRSMHSCFHLPAHQYISLTVYQKTYFNPKPFKYFWVWKYSPLLDKVSSDLTMTFQLVTGE